MTMIEFLLGTAYNARALFNFLAFLSGAGLFISTFGVFVSHSYENDGETRSFDPATRKFWRHSWLLCITILGFTIVPACVPNVEDLWKIRIGMIKLQLASPQNVEKGAAEIIRIGKKLECRYLGCEEEKANAKPTPSKHP